MVYQAKEEALPYPKSEKEKFPLATVLTSAFAYGVLKMTEMTTLFLFTSPTLYLVESFHQTVPAFIFKNYLSASIINLESKKTVSYLFLNPAASNPYSSIYEMHNKCSLN